MVKIFRQMINASYNIKEIISRTTFDYFISHDINEIKNLKRIAIAVS